MTKRLRKGLIALLLVLVMACTVVVTVLFTRHETAKADEEWDTWDGDLIAAGWGDPEDKDKPADYVVSENGKEISIGSGAALAYFAHEVYIDADHNLDGATVTLTKNIDLDNHMWIPIGQTNRTTALAGEIRFSGTFDGDGHTIKNFSTENYNVQHVTGVAGVTEGDYNVYKYTGTEKSYEKDTAYIPFKAKGQEYSYGLFGIAYNITIENLNIENVKIDLHKMEVGSTTYLTDSIAAIVGYATGNIYIKNCTVGSSDHTEDNNTIKLRDDDGGAAAGIIGRLYAYNGSAGAFTKFELTDCVNYLNIDTATSKLQTGGIVGLIDYGVTAKVERCVNYGKIDSGSHAGGIIGTWTPSNTDGEGKQTDYCWLFDCENFGNIYSGTTGSRVYVGGIVGEYYDNQCKNVKFIADGNVNYGNVGGHYTVGGIFGTTDPGGTGAAFLRVLTNNYNYGDVYSFGAVCAGGYVGYESSTSLGTNVYIVSGGNLGTIYGSATFKGQNYGGSKGNHANPPESDGSAIEDEIDKKFLIAAGELVAEFNTATGMPASKYTAPVLDHHLDAVYREVNEYGNYVFSDNKLSYIYNYKREGDVFAYADDSYTTIIGIKDGAQVPATAVIPESVTAIEYGALAGYTEITAVDWGNSSVTDIGLAAFAATGLKSVSLPASVKTVGEGAFMNCADLNNVTLSAGAENIELGVNVFANTRDEGTDGSTYYGAYIIATSNAQYRQLLIIDNYANCGGILTHEVEISFYYKGVVQETVTKLHNQSYNIVKQDDGSWTYLGGVSVPEHGDGNWFYETEARPYQNADDMNGLLVKNVDRVILTAYDEGISNKYFEARKDLVFDENTIYTAQDINKLLDTNYNLFEKGMEVVIYKLGEGEAKEAVDSIQDAGKYEIVISEGETVYPAIELTIAPKEIDLSNLVWNIVSVGETSGAVDMRTATLYIYTYKAGGEYPSFAELNDEQIKYLNLNAGYTIIDVELSAVRNRGAEIVIEIADDTSFELVGLYSGNKGTEIGTYSAQVTLKATGNYVFTKGNIDGVIGVGSSDGNTATITKVWYIAEASNWLTSGSEDYTVSGHTYGGNISFGAPGLRYGTPTSDITLTLYYSGYENGEVAVSNRSFTVNEFGNYINSSMPAGNYTLKIEVADVTVEDEDGKEVFHAGFVEEYTFTVAKAELPKLDSVHAALNGKSFTFEKGTDVLYDETVDAVIKSYIGNGYSAGTGIWNSDNLKEWAGEEINYYGAYAIEFNLLRSYNDSYNATLTLDKADTYTVYYRFSAPNYYSSIENLASDETRFSYSFTVITYEKVGIPKIDDGGLFYTGYAVRPVVPASSLYYESDVDEVFIDGGEHAVKVKLYDTDHYRWMDNDGNAIDGAEVLVYFTIHQAEDNRFTVALNVIGWEYESFKEDVNNIHVAAKYLDEGEDIRFSIKKEGATAPVNAALADFKLEKDENGELTVVGSTALNALKALSRGIYVLTATVDSTDNYVGFSDSITFEISRARNAWLLDEENEFNIPSWIVGRYDPENDDHKIIITALHGTVYYRIEDMEIEGKEYYNSKTSEIDLAEALNSMKVGQYLLIAWVDDNDNYDGLAAYTFKFQIFEAPGLPWWGTLLIAVGSLLLAALIIFILWKKGVFRIITDKILVSIRTRVSVEATIASVRAAKMAEEGKKSVAEAKRRERLEEMREKQRSMTPEERAAQLEAKAQADAARAEKLRARSEKDMAKVEKMRQEADAEVKEEAPSDTMSEVASTDDNPETPTEE